MKKLTLVLSTALLAGLGTVARAQVQDVSFTVAPVVGYTHWDSKLNLGDAPYWGVRAGFGFGPLFEVRGLYERSFDLKGQGASSPAWLAKWLDKLEDANAQVERYGGELKLNLWSNAFFTPYLTAGGGVMKFTYTGTPQVGLPTDYKEEQIYGAGGLGLKFNLGRRVALSLEGRDLMFNVNPNNRFLSSPTSGNKLLHNWTGQASLDLYFGGSTYRPADAVSRAYKNMYTGGFRGLKFVVEPGVAYVNFAESTGFADQWFFGGNAGVDFSPIFGLRGFYYIATEQPNTLNLKVNKELAMYGGNFVARLNMPLGLTPYLNLGAGYLDASKRYVGSGNGVDPKSGLFLFGGAGLEIPLHRYVALHGNINAMLTQRGNPDITNVTSPEQVKVSTFYQAGLRINLGRSAQSGRALYEDYSARNVSTAVSEANEANLRELNELRASYDARINKLNKELAEAVSRRDTITVTRVLREKEDLRDRISTVDQHTDQLAVAHAQSTPERDHEATDRRRDDRDRDHHRDAKGYDRDDKDGARVDATSHATPSTKHGDKPEGKKCDQAGDACQRGKGSRTVTLTTGQFEQLVRRVISEVNQGQQTQSTSLGVNEVTNSNLSDLDKILLLNALYQGQYRLNGLALQPLQLQGQQVAQPQQAQQAQSEKKEDAKAVDASVALIKRLDQVIDRLDAISEAQAKALNVAPVAPERREDRTPKHQPAQATEHHAQAPDSSTILVVDLPATIAEQEQQSQAHVQEVRTPEASAVRVSGVSVFAGPNFGDAFGLNVGVRAHLQFHGSRFDLVPDAYYGLGDGKHYGVNANLRYNLPSLFSESLTPYLGVGLGYNKVGGVGRFLPNYVVGTSLNQVLGGGLYIDYTVRGAFRNNQLAVGYRFHF